MDEALKTFFAHEGIVDTIIDFTGVPRLDFETSVVSDRGRRPSRKSDTRRVFVVNTPVLFGTMRLYSAHQEHHGYTPPTKVHSLAEAHDLQQAPDARFEPVAF